MSENYTKGVSGKVASPGARKKFREIAERNGDGSAFLKLKRPLVGRVAVHLKRAE